MNEFGNPIWVSLKPNVHTREKKIKKKQRRKYHESDVCLQSPLKKMKA